MLAGCLFLLAGMAVTFGAIAAATAAGFLAGTAVAGVGFGLAFLGAFRMITALAAPGDRRPAGRHLHRGVPRVQHPGAGRWHRDDELRVAPDGPGLRRLARRHRRGGGRHALAPPWRRAVPGLPGPPAKRCRRARAPVRPARGRWTRRAPALPPRRPGNPGPRASAAGRGRGLTTGALLWQLNAIEAGCAEADDTDGGRRERVH